LDAGPSLELVMNRWGLTATRSEVDHNGVLYNPDDRVDDELAESEPPRRTEPRKARRVPRLAPVATHQFDRDYFDPMVCRACGLPERNRRHDVEAVQDLAPDDT